LIEARRYAGYEQGVCDMTVLDIVTYPADILKDGALPVANIDGKLQQLIDDMAQTMYARQGVGLAAVQVDSGLRLVIYDVSDQREKQQFRVVINPEIVAADGECISEQEGCLSVPELRTDVKRAATVRVAGVDREGRPLVIDAEGLEAIVLQHEIDHLNGTLILDRASRLKRELYKRKVQKRIKQAWQET